MRSPRPPGADAAAGPAGEASAGAPDAASAGGVESGAAPAVAGEGVGAAAPGAGALLWHATRPDARTEKSTRVLDFMTLLPLSF